MATEASIESVDVTSDPRTAAFRLAAYSFLILFFELALIRYLPATVKVFSFYINMVLIATFVGMGAGLLAVRSVSRLRWALLPIVVFLLALTKWFSNVMVITPDSSQEFLWAVYWDMSPNVTEMGILPTLAMIFAVTALFFVPLGAMLGEEFARFRPLVAYSLDIAGSLAGILCFALVSYVGWSPWAWFALGFAILAVASLPHRRFVIGVLATAPVAIALVVTNAEPNEEWSPYYRINWYRKSDAQYVINVNGSMHLTAMDLSDRGAALDDFVGSARYQYRAPYQLVEHYDTVLVLGAGAGNDVALLLDMGAKYIDAVEIDPEIAEFGRGMHQQHPYDDPRVNVRVNDARAFLRQTERTYDLIVFGTLDSQTLLSGMTSVRLDNYVYTREALRDAKAVLAPGGRLVMYHMSPMPAIAAKIFQLLAGTFEEPPAVFHWQTYTLFNYAFVAGAWKADEWKDVTFPRHLIADVHMPTDDWPFLYLVRRTFPLHYIEGLAVVLSISLLLVLAAGGKGMRGNVDLELFFLGLGFMLLETKSVTEMSLLFGSTWGVNLLVFSSILIVILAANWLVILKRGIKLRPVLVSLLVSLGVGFAVPVRSLAGGSLWVEWIIGGALVATPIFFAALTFATLFRDRVNSVRALGYNLFGAAVGGVLEYSVMIWGVKKLYLIAAVAYALVWLLTERSSAPSPARRPVLD